MGLSSAAIQEKFGFSQTTAIKLRKEGRKLMEEKEKEKQKEKEKSEREQSTTTTETIHDGAQKLEATREEQDGHALTETEEGEEGFDRFGCASVTLENHEQRKKDSLTAK